MRNSCRLLVFSLSIVGMIARASSAPGEDVQRFDDEAPRAYFQRVEEKLGTALAAEAAARLRAVVLGYPEQVRGVRTVGGGTIFLVMRDGSQVPFEDGLGKGYEERIARPDVADMLHDSYPRTLDRAQWPRHFDPGRYRNDAFLKAVYGDSAGVVRANLDRVEFCGHRVPFNRRNGAAAALRRVAKELDLLRTAAPARFDPYLAKLGGTFSWRTIAGTKRLSAHSYGISIDLNPDLGGYWRWESEAALGDMRRRRKYPAEIVAAFEKHGFIWGGKWYHFDLMHFEYRPELLALASPRASRTKGSPRPIEKTRD